MSTSQEYRSTSHTAIASSESTLPKRQSSGPKKNLELTLDSKVVQMVSGYLSQNFTEITPAYDQRGSTRKAKAIQDPQPRKTGAPKGPSQSTSTTEAPEDPKPSRSRSTLSLKERVRRAKAVRAQAWKPKAQGSSQKLPKTSSTTGLDSGGTISSTSEPPDQTPGPSKADDASSFSESTSTNLSNSESFLELTNLLTKEVQ